MENNPQKIYELTIIQTMEQVVSAAQAIPLERELSVIIQDAARATERTYYLPDEDERLRIVFASYLRTRSILLEAIASLMPVLGNKLNWQNELRTFVTGFTAGCMLVRATKFIIQMAKQQPVLWNKLDESEQRFGIERKSISKLYENISSAKNMFLFHQAVCFYEDKKAEIYALANHGELDQEMISLLKQEEPMIASRKRDYFSLRLRYRVYDILRKNTSGYKKAMFHFFRVSGSAIAEMKQPKINPLTHGISPKRVTQHLLQEIQQKLTPGDVIITRHDDALSNLFLPGFWPHAAFYMGSPNEHELISETKSLHADFQMIESKKDGVKFRPLSETLAVDNFVVIRPRLSQESIWQAIQKAMSHVGKRYDFLFDFTQADRLACTELVYRAYHGVDELEFSLNPHSGRMCISAEDLIDQLLRSGRFEVFALFTEKSGKIIYDSEARAALEVSYASQW